VVDTGRAADGLVVVGILVLALNLLMAPVLPALFRAQPSGERRP
jgi:hypothetical protein